jgi:dihydroxy-acid dehydratase
VQGVFLTELHKEEKLSKTHFRQVFLDRKKQIPFGLAVLFGNLAPEGALFCVNGVRSQWLASSGPVRVFKSEKACEQALLNKKIKKGDVLVLQYCGPRGAPGMTPMGRIKNALEKAGLVESVMILTDGRLEELGKTPAIVHVCPEAALRGPFAVLQDGDQVSWNFYEKSLGVRLTDTEIKVRLSCWKEPDIPCQDHFLKRYYRHCSSAAQGAVFL